MSAWTVLAMWLLAMSAGAGPVLAGEREGGQQEPAPTPRARPHPAPEVPKWWPGSFATRPHPRGPGPINGPHPAAGRYLDVIRLPRGDLQRRAHLKRADSWEPEKKSHGALDPARAIDCVVAHALTGDERYLRKAADYAALLRAKKYPSGFKGFTWQAMAILYDHFRDDLEAGARQLLEEKALEMVLEQIAENDVPGCGWGDMTWEGFGYSTGCVGFAWLIGVFYDAGNEDWVRIGRWFGNKMYRQVIPWLTAVAVGDYDGGQGASWPTSGYWRSNLDSHIYHWWLALSVLTGVDHFREYPWYALMLRMADYRPLPNGRDIAWNMQADWIYTPGRKPAGVFQGYDALAAAVRDPVALGRGDCTDPLQILSPPWSHFFPEDAPTQPQESLPLARRFTSFTIARTGWSEDSAVASWRRGDAIGHHLQNDPGNVLLYGKATADGAGAWILGHPRTYGMGWGSEAYGRAAARYTGLKFFDPQDPSNAAPGWFFVEPGTEKKVKLPYLRDGGPKRINNPVGFRVSQSEYQLNDPYQDWLNRQDEFDQGNGVSWAEGAVGATRFVAEFVDWSPSFRRFPGRTIRGEAAARRTDRLPPSGGWIRGCVFLHQGDDGAHPVLIVFDRVELLRPEIAVECQWFTIRQPKHIEANVWQILRKDLVKGRKGLDRAGNWTHVKKYRGLAGFYRYGGEAWMQSWSGAESLAATAPDDVFQLGGPEATFAIVEDGFRSGNTPIDCNGRRGVVYRGGGDGTNPLEGPQELATWLTAVCPPPGRLHHRFLHVFNTGPEKYPATVSESAGSTTVKVAIPGGPVEVTISPECEVSVH